MPDTPRLWAFIGAVVVVIAIPGPSVLFIASRALAEGRRAALLTVVGNTVGEYLQVVAVAVAAALVVRDGPVFEALRVGGGTYLVYLGVQAIRHRHEFGAVPAAGTRRRRRYGELLDGFLVGALNPKTLVFLAAILLQFVKRSAGHIGEQVLLLGGIFSVLVLLGDSCWALAAASLRAGLARSAGRAAMLALLGGSIMTALGLALGFSALGV